MISRCLAGLEWTASPTYLLPAYLMFCPALWPPAARVLRGVCVEAVTACLRACGFAIRSLATACEKEAACDIIYGQPDR